MSAIGDTARELYSYPRPMPKEHFVPADRFIALATELSEKVPTVLWRCNDDIAIWHSDYVDHPDANVLLMGVAVRPKK